MRLGVVCTTLVVVGSVLWVPSWLFGAGGRGCELASGVVLGQRDVASTIWFQGFLADIDTGEPVNGDVDIVVALYDVDVGGTPLWGPESHPGTTVAEGWFNVELGSVVSPLPSFDNPPYYLGLSVDGEVLTPRLKLGSVPSAFQASSADDAANGFELPYTGSVSTGGTAFSVVNSGGGTVGCFTQRDPTSNSAAVYGITDGDGPAVVGWSNGNGPAVMGHAGSTGLAGMFDGNADVLGLLCVSSDTLAADIQGGYGADYSTAVSVEYTPTGTYNASALSVDCRPADYYGTGVEIWAGYNGVNAIVAPTGSETYIALWGQVDGGSGQNYGVYGRAYGSGTNYAVYGEALGSGGTNYAGYFDGDVHVAGELTATTKTFKIDHPLDPANKYLVHACVESPEMKNVYDGVVVLDAAGEAWVELPDWFEALNGDFRYQLTAIGAPGPNLYIAEKIAGNRFRIAGGEPGMEVCWQVTGIRHDKYAEEHPIVVEEGKRPEDRGKYLHPELYGGSRQDKVGPVEPEKGVY